MDRPNSASHNKKQTRKALSNSSSFRDSGLKTSQLRNTGFKCTTHRYQRKVLAVHLNEKMRVRAGKGKVRGKVRRQAETQVQRKREQGKKEKEKKKKKDPKT